MVRPSAFAEEADQAASLLRVGGGVVAVLVCLQWLRRWWNPTTDAPQVTPIVFTLAVVGVLLAIYLLVVRVRLVDSQRLRWMVAGCCIAGATLLFQAVVVAELSEMPELVAPSGVVALTWLRHAGLAMFAFGALATPTRRRLRHVLVAVFALLFAVVVFEPTWELLPLIVGTGGSLTELYRWGTASVMVLIVAAAIFYAVGCGRWVAGLTSGSR